MGHAKKSKIEIGLFSIPVRLEVAVDTESSEFRTVCTGGGTHDPVRVKMHVDCTECGASHSSVWGYPERGVEQDGKIVLVTSEQIKAAAGEPIDTLALTFCAREDVYAKTLAADSVQNVYPDKGGVNGYQALVDHLSSAPGLVGVSIWAPSKKNALWVLEVVDGRLVASKRAWPEDVRQPQAIPDGEVTAGDKKMLAMVVEHHTTAFDVTEWRNAAKQGIGDLIASRLGEATMAPATAGSGAVVGDTMSALQAELDRIKATKKAPVKKVAAKKAVAKKAAPVKKAAAKRPVKKSVRQKEVA